MTGEARPVTVSTLLMEYGLAFGSDWSSVDGRWVRDDMDDLGILVEKYGSGPLTPKDAEKGRADLDLCPHGLGHWTEWCMPDEKAAR